MAIKGLTDTVAPSLPRLGDIKKGEKTPKGHPRKLPYFRFVVAGKLEGEVSPLETLFTEAYGEMPTSVMAMFIGNTEDSVLWTAMRAKANEGKTKRVCDRESASMQLVKKGEQWIVERGAFPCGWDNTKGECTFGCKAEGRLTFVLMTPEGNEPLFVNGDGFPIGTVGHRISETDIKNVLGTLRGAMSMAPLMGMTVKLYLKEWQSKHGAVYGTNLLFTGIYRQFRQPALEAPKRPALSVNTEHLSDNFEQEDDEGLDNFGVDEGELVDETPVTTVVKQEPVATEKQYRWAWATYCLIPDELDYILLHKVDKKRLPHQVDAACKQWATQIVKFDDAEWVSGIWTPFLDHIQAPVSWGELIQEIPMDEANMLVYRKELIAQVAEMGKI